MLKNKNILITGCTGGIGKAVLIECAKNGADIWAHARTETPEFQKMVDDLSNSYNVSISAVYFDLGKTDDLKENIKNILKTKKNIDGLVNCAALPYGGTFMMTPVSKIKDIFDINLFSQMEITQLILKAMFRQRSGSIVNVSSVAGLDLHAGNSAYGVSKAALAAWTKTLAAECAQAGIRVNAVAPGITDTAMAAKMEKNAAEHMLASSAMKRMARPEEIAKTIVFLLSDEASFINGQIIRIDGGNA